MIKDSHFLRANYLSIRPFSPSASSSLDLLITPSFMNSRRRRSSTELAVRSNVLAASLPVDAEQTGLSYSSTGMADVGGVALQLEPADGGAAAWRVLFAAFMFEAVLFGDYRLSLHPSKPVDETFTYCIDSRLLSLIWCFPKLLYQASRIQGKLVSTYRRDNGVWYTVSWRARDGSHCQTLSTLPPIHYLDRMATVYLGTYRQLFCEQPRSSHIHSRYHVW